MSTHTQRSALLRSPTAFYDQMKHYALSSPLVYSFYMAILPRLRTVGQSPSPACQTLPVTHKKHQSSQAIKTSTDTGQDYRHMGCAHQSISSCPPSVCCTECWKPERQQAGLDQPAPTGLLRAHHHQIAIGMAPTQAGSASLAVCDMVPPMNCTTLA